MFRAVVLIGLSFFVWQGKPSKEVRAKLFKQILADDADLRECIGQQEGGAAAAQENMMIEEYDLNRDGVKEYEVQLSGICSCGTTNCAIYLYRSTRQGFEGIIDSASGIDLQLLETSSNGYRDLQINAHDSAVTKALTLYKFDGKQYREAQTRIINVETGESKLDSRRLQFKRGSSSATVQGRVSIALPDTYLVGARAGQVMSVQLTSPQKSDRFLVMTSKSTNLLADNARTWTGTLPETGDYHIIVDGDERGGTYTMTI